MDTMKGKSFLSMLDVGRDELLAIFVIAEAMKRGRFDHYWRNVLSGKPVAFMSEKPSLRTIDSFLTGIAELGGIPIHLPADSIRMGAREEIADVARTIGRLNQMIVARVSKHGTLDALKKWSGVPVINALSDWEHPCQALGDFFTIREKFGTFDGLHLAYIGASNNVSNSLVIGAATLSGIRVTLCCPKEYQSNAVIIEKAAAMGLDLLVTPNPLGIVDADIIYTDVWTSMGEEGEREKRLEILRSYQVDPNLMGRQSPNAVLMHCLPAHRGEEVTAEIIDGRQSIVFDQAENRLYVQNAAMALIMNPDSVSHLLK